MSVETCEQVGALPETLQVAWVSRLAARAGARTGVPVVRVAELRKLAEARGRDPVAVLQALGLAGKKANGRWKVVIFDVKREWLCRPVDADPADDFGGLDVCDVAWQAPSPGQLPRSHTGCGYLVDSQTGVRTLDSFRVEWGTAVTWGFCVLPLSRFLEGA